MAQKQLDIEHSLSLHITTLERRIKKLNPFYRKVIRELVPTSIRKKDPARWVKLIEIELTALTHGPERA